MWNNSTKTNLKEGVEPSLEPLFRASVTLFQGIPSPFLFRVAGEGWQLYDGGQNHETLFTNRLLCRQKG